MLASSSALASSPATSRSKAALNRLTNVTYANGDTEAFTYDVAGNRLTHTVNGQQVASYTYDVAGQLLSDGTISYSHDAAGNLTAAGTDSFSWDWANRLTSATVSGTTVTYAYDGDGTRTSSTAGGVTTPYVWDREGAVEYLVDDGSHAYLHHQGLLSAIDGSNVTTYPLADGLGSIRGHTDSNENLIGTATYSAIGAMRSQTGATSLFGFTGEQFDGITGNLYLRARYFSPGLGRFLSADTVQPNAPGTQGYNLYTYVANNPTTWIDPTGQFAIGGVGLVLLGLILAIVFYIIAQCLAGITCDFSGSASPSDYVPRAPGAPHLGPPWEWDRPGIEIPWPVPWVPDLPFTEGDENDDLFRYENPPWDQLERWRGRTRTNGESGRNRRYYEWDYTHKDVEVYDRRGDHLGSMDPETGEMTKPRDPNKDIKDKVR